MRARRTAAASALPPPKPASVGILLLIRIAKPVVDTPITSTQNDKADVVQMQPEQVEYDEPAEDFGGDISTLMSFFGGM